MIPYKLLFNIGSKAVGGFMQRRRDISEQKHRVALEEVRNGAVRAKRAGSLFLDLLVDCKKHSKFFSIGPNKFIEKYFNFFETKLMRTPFNILSIIFLTKFIIQIL